MTHFVFTSKLSLTTWAQQTSGRKYARREGPEYSSSRCTSCKIVGHKANAGKMQEVQKDSTRLFDSDSQEMFTGAAALHFSDSLWGTMNSSLPHQKWRKVGILTCSYSVLCLLCQWWVIYGTWAKFGPPKVLIRPATCFIIMNKNNEFHS